YPRQWKIAKQMLARAKARPTAWWQTTRRYILMQIIIIIAITGTAANLPRHPRQEPPHGQNHPPLPFPSFPALVARRPARALPAERPGSERRAAGRAGPAGEHHRRGQPAVRHAILGRERRLYGGSGDRGHQDAR